MTEPDASWDHWRSFLAVLRQGSLSRAARDLGLTQPTLGRHVDLLEAVTGAKLFTRSRSGLLPTERALALRAEAEAMEAMAASLERRARTGSETAGTVRVTASEAIGTFVLPAILAQLRTIEPRIAVELALADRNADLLTREADIAVRMVRPAQQALVMRPLGAVRLGLFAHRDYLARAGPPRTIEALFDHALIGPDRDLAQGFALGGRIVRPNDLALRCDSDPARFMAISAGLGIGPCQVGIAAANPDLVPVLQDEVGFSLDMHLAMHEDLRALAPVRAVFDHLARALEAYACGEAPAALFKPAALR